MPGGKKERVVFVADKKVSKPVKVEFYTQEGAKISFKGHKTTTKPVKVEFYVREEQKK